MNNTVPSICAVVITFHPDLDRLEQLICSLATQVNTIVIVDNGSFESLDDFAAAQNLPDQLVVLSLDDNFGIAHAQNVGIDYARKVRSSHVILFDQDSCPEPTMTAELYQSAFELQQSGVRLAAVAPAYKDSEQGSLSSFVRVGLFGFKRLACTEGDRVVEADFLIASGSLIPMSVIDDVGEMDASLFIDHVDTEWCFRAKSKGYKLFGVCQAEMLHSLGDRRIRVWFLRWRTIPYHSPFRYYYMFRNSVLLQRRSYMPVNWKVADLTRCIVVFLFFGIFSSSRSASLKMMLRGFRDGLKGVTGKIK
ncbi:glycosyltransferase family 2 protein [Pseudomonas atagonensis]|uniref:glycosyltransferase family 2 protein n=1 Tax=Pseudomonas atagonensis TaxID=2609964 RepID=UPI00140A9274|nr:glycosyltransferase family 2 protein [Pseudomonas atagonensis]